MKKIIITIEVNGRPLADIRNVIDYFEESIEERGGTVTIEESDKPKQQ